MLSNEWRYNHANGDNIGIGGDNGCHGDNVYGGNIIYCVGNVDNRGDDAYRGTMHTVETTHALSLQLSKQPLKQPSKCPSKPSFGYPLKQPLERAINYPSNTPCSVKTINLYNGIEKRKI